MVRFLLILVSILFVISCATKPEEDNSIAKTNKVQTEKAIKPLPQVITNRISIKRQFIPGDDLEQFVLDLKGEDFTQSKLTFVILDKNKDTLFARNGVSGAILLSDADAEVDTEEEQMEYIIHKMSTFFSIKNFSTPCYTINDPNSEDFNGNLKIWSEIENDSTAVCFEFAMRPNGGSEVLVYSRLLDSIVVYDKTH
jgi:hypothetical protein